MKKIILLSFIITTLSCKKNTYQHIKGTAFGTDLNVKLKTNSKRNWEKSIDSLVEIVNNSLSTYRKNSIISKINQGDTTVIVDNQFKEVYAKAKRIYQETNGVFDPTIGVLVNAWDFGPEKKIKNLDSATIQNLMQEVGFNKISLKNNRLIKKNPKTYIDFNAIAKGYGIDVIGRFIEKNGIQNYMVEIGGEVRAKGKNKSRKYWRIGIENPNFDGTQSYNKIISLQDESIATSGTYRKFKVDKNGNRYAHILNTKTGYPSKSDVLSASVIGKMDCADVDGYATTFIALGLDGCKQFLKKHPELKSFIIY
ncbi:MAG TPA: FAD:protein FMN transferase, partial [Flavobacteriia bacterium]|nr:FAD:protein FMN transferase [Flavobacteriia bacterium]